MADIVSPDKRSKMMASIRAKNTKPEMLVRQRLHARGFRYSLHPRYLPGKPDLFLRKFNAVVFVNGCFWHAHDCHLFKLPSTRENFWKNKFASNVVRDRANQAEIINAGLRVATVWECAMKNKDLQSIETMVDKLAAWIMSDSVHTEFKGDVPRG